MANFSLDNFRQTVLGSGLARKNRFEVEIAFPNSVQAELQTDSRIVSILADSAILPEMTINAELQQIWGPAHHRPKSISYGGFMVIGFHLDQQMDVKRFFDVWMQNIVDGQQYTVSYQKDYVAPSMTVTQLDDQFNATYAVTFEEVFPAGQTQIDLSHSLVSSTHLLQVNFRYRRWYEGQKRGSNSTNSNFLNKNTIDTAPPAPDNWATITGEANQEIGGSTIQPLGVAP